MFSDWWSDVRFRFRALFRRRELERELDDEVRFHLELETDKLVTQGLPRAEAMRRARLAFGSVEGIKEDSRGVRGISVVDIVMQDVQYALRGIRRRPAFSAAVILTLALGIGANATMFAVTDRVMFRAPTMLRDPDMVHRVYVMRTGAEGEHAMGWYQYTRYLDLRKWTTSFSQVAARSFGRLALGTGTDAREMMVGAVSVSFFSLFDATPAIGRFFVAQEDTVPRGAPVVVLSYAYWQTRYGGRADVLGQTLQVGKVLCTIVGVAPDGLTGLDLGESPAVWMPITTYAATRFVGNDATNFYTTYNWGWMQMFVRRNPGVSVAAATADLTSAMQRSYSQEIALDPRAAPASVVRPRAIAAPIQVSRGPDAGRDSRVMLWVTGVSLVVLLIACANVANLLLAHALRRRREIAVRLAIGVSRKRLLSQLLAESLVLSVLGGAAGMCIAAWGGQLLRALFLPQETTLPVFTDARTLTFAGALALMTGVLTGLVPALHAGRDDLASTLKAGARDGTFQRSRTRGLLVVVQGALSVVLLVGAGLFVRSLRNVQSIRLGFDIDPVVLVTRNMRSVSMSDTAQAALSERMLEAAKVFPGVEAASRALTVPMQRTWSVGVYVDGVDSAITRGGFNLQAGSPDFFRTTGTRILRGRAFTAQDRAHAPLVAVVSESMAKLLWPGQQALGQCMRVQADSLPCTTVVGISENMRQSGPTSAVDHTFFLPIEQFHPERADLFVRVRGDAGRMAESLRRHLQPLMPGDSYLTATPFKVIVDEHVESWRAGATMFLAFGSLALVLAAVGLYSVIAYNVTQRTQELGVRLALGAQQRDVLRLIVAEGFQYAVIGVAIGGIIALGAAGRVQPLLFNQSARDPVVFGAAIGILLVVALVASLVPAWRASRLDANIALRAE